LVIDFDAGTRTSAITGEEAYGASQIADVTM
jgi:hypothetical protein